MEKNVLTRDAPGGAQASRTRRALKFVLPHRRTITVIILMIFLAAAFEAAEPLALKFIFDRIGGRAVRPLVLGVAALLALGLSRELLGGISDWMSWRVRLKVNYGILEQTVSRLYSLPISFHHRQSVGGIMNKLDRGVNGLVAALSEMAFNLLPAALYLCISLAVMFRLDWKLSLIVLFFAPMPALIGMWASREQTERERSLTEQWAGIFSRFGETLAGMLTVKSFTMEEAEKGRFLSGVHGANEVVARGVATDTRVSAAKNVAALVARIASIALGGYFVYKGRITIGTLVAFLGYLGGLFGPVQGLTGVYQTIRKASVSADIVFSILDQEDNIPDRPGACKIKSIRGEVIFDRVSFSYAAGREPAIKNMDLHVSPGEKLAVVGPSGAGKTSMISLLQRLYEPCAGAIFLDGMDIREIAQRSLRSQIGVVFQEAIVFNDTIKNNIAYGRPGASEREIEQAARDASAHGFISRMPGGYNALAGERGSRLSTGERQRINIARALLKDPALIILDEATSALDAESEALVQEALARLLEGRTAFIIAHRLSTIMKADRIVVLRDGRIIECGPHRELMAAGGYYASLVRKQTPMPLFSPN